MDHWARKHACDIASVAREHSLAGALSADQRHAFEEIEALASTVARGDPGSPPGRIDTVAAAMCSACKSAGLVCQCGGRHHWRQSCCLVAASIAT